MSVFSSKIDKLSQLQKMGLQTLQKGEQILEIDPDLIIATDQIRKTDSPGFSEESLKELANSMKYDGQDSPIILREHPEKASHYILVAGERRWRAAKIHGLRLKAIVRNLTPEEARRVQISENIQRENLTQIEIALALREDKTRLGTLEKVAQEWNKGVNWVSERLKFLATLEADTLTGKAVLSGLTSDISAINDLQRLEKISPLAVQEILEYLDKNPTANIRNLIRERKRRATPRQSRMRESNIKPGEDTLTKVIKKSIQALEHLQTSNSYKTDTDLKKIAQAHKSLTEVYDMILQRSSHPRV